MKTAYTRKQYMDGDVTHRVYYGQFVTPHIQQVVLRTVGLDKLLASRDEHFNDIKLPVWDSIIGFTNNGSPRISNALGLSLSLKQADDCISACSLICVLKEAARQIVDSKGGIQS